MNARAAAAFAIVLLGACGGSTATTDHDSTPVATAPAALDLELRHATGEPLDLSAFRGHRVLLYLFATFDLPSQAALEPLREVAQEHPELIVVGIALQPNASELLPIFATALSIEFPLAYEAANLLLRGLTDLGEIEGVPTYVLLDRDGVITQRTVGPMGAHALRRWCGFE